MTKKKFINLSQPHWNVGTHSIRLRAFINNMAYWSQEDKLHGCSHASHTENEVMYQEGHATTMLLPLSWLYILHLCWVELHT